MSSALPGSAPGQSPEGTLPPGGGTVYTGGSPNFDETAGQYRNLPGGMTLGGKGGVPPPPGTPTPPWGRTIVSSRLFLMSLAAE
mgnify:CR=1 FL=1